MGVVTQLYVSSYVIKKMTVNPEWKQFERLVAAIHHAESQGALVTWNDTIQGRQFDVTIRFNMLMYLTKVSICRTIASWHDQDFREHCGSFGGNSLLMLPAWSTWRKADGRRDSSARNAGAKSIG